MRLDPPACSRRMKADGTAARHLTHQWVARLTERDTRSAAAASFSDQMSTPVAPAGGGLSLAGRRAGAAGRSDLKVARFADWLAVCHEWHAPLASNASRRTPRTVS